MGIMVVTADEKYLSELAKKMDEDMEAKQVGIEKYLWHETSVPEQFEEPIWELMEKIHDECINN